MNLRAYCINILLFIATGEVWKQENENVERYGIWFSFIWIVNKCGSSVADQIIASRAGNGSVLVSILHMLNWMLDLVFLFEKTYATFIGTENKLTIHWHKNNPGVEIELIKEFVEYLVAY